MQAGQVSPRSCSSSSIGPPLLQSCGQLYSMLTMCCIVARDRRSHSLLLACTTHDLYRVVAVAVAVRLARHTPTHSACPPPFAVAVG
jgi:hypothetical protein